MYYRLSNVAGPEEIESAFSARFKHPKIYEENQLVNGLDETLVPIIKQESTALVDYAIWGILPEGFKEEWSVFQSQMNTLNIEADRIEKLPWLSGLLSKQRCIIIATGFFTNYVFEGELYPYHIHLPNMKPFAMAGVYTQLEDGFYTTALLTTTSNSQLKQVQHLGAHMPFALASEQHDIWISKGTSIQEARQLLSEEPGLSFKTDPVAKVFHKNEIRYSGLLDRVSYLNIPFSK